jgi:MFS family permease
LSLVTPLSSLSPVPRARTAIFLVFFILGAAGGIWAVFIPIVRARFGIDEAVLGIVLLTLAGGALLAMPVTGWAIARFGGRKLTAVLAVTAPLAATLPLLAPTLWLLFIAAFLQGANWGALDVAMNTEAARVETARGRPSMSAFHGLYSIGGLVGAGVAALLLSLGLAAGWAAAGVLVVFAVLAGLARGWYLPDDRTEPEPFRFALPSKALLGLGLLAFLSIGLEGAVGDWSALFLTTNKTASPAEAASGFAAFAGAMAVMRLIGDRLVTRFGRRLTLAVGGAVVAVGCVVALAAPWPILSAAGFGLIGVGAANVFPILFSTAARYPVSSGGLPAVATLGYVGFLSWPPIIGWIAHGVSLTAALSLIGLAGVAIGFGARFVQR